MAVKADSLPFEKALERLEGIVEKLESGSVALSDSVKLFEEGITLRKRCLTLLKEAEAKVKFLTASTSGTVSEEDAPDGWEDHDTER
jgi:exodeoxyribonuclease VII small subunit